jgi:tetratricopeptide (TPR) repeat protein
MNRTVILAAAAALALSSAGALAMGGGGGGYGGGYGGMSGNMPAVDDYSMALRLIHREKYAEAIPYLDRALAAHQHSADILNYEGYTHRMVGDLQTSYGYYQQALTIDPDHKGVHEYLGELYLMMRNMDKANAELAELTRLCPSGCDEKDALVKAIGDYQAKLQAAAPPPASAPAAQPATTQQ